MSECVVEQINDVTVPSVMESVDAIKSIPQVWVSERIGKREKSRG